MWATPTIPDRRLGVNDDYYAWVIGGCPNQDVDIVRNGESSRIELSTPTFKFKEFEDVYFHAQVKACKNNDCVSCPTFQRFLHLLFNRKLILGLDCMRYSKQFQF